MSEPRSQTPLTPEQAADAATGNGMPGKQGQAWPAMPEEVAAAALHRASVNPEAMPASLTRRLEALIDADVIAPAAPARNAPLASPAGTELKLAGSSREPAAGRRSWMPSALAAAASLAFGVSLVMLNRSAALNQAQLAAAYAQVAAMDGRIKDNDALLAAAKLEIAAKGQENAQLAQRELQLAEQLAQATSRYAALESEHTLAQLKIARLESPVDPVEMQRNRTKLLEVPGTVRLAWSPFNLEGAAPAEQPGISGDAVWNDEAKTGYLRFVGLKVNDPRIEQYQVWVIDERGLEQKVSGGIFNATADGEVIVPIKPGIDVGKVVLFAITIEKPGGTWVPDLKRRVVVAPRGA